MALNQIGIKTHRDLAAADIETVVADGDAALDDIVDPVDCSRFSVVTDSQAEAIRDDGYETLRDIATAEVDALASVATTLTEPKAEKLIETATNEAVMFEAPRASTAIQFAHKTREDGTQSWPTLSTRNLTVICEHIADGASPKAAVKNELWAVAEPKQYPEDSHTKLNDYL